MTVREHRDSCSTRYCKTTETITKTIENDKNNNYDTTTTRQKNDMNSTSVSPYNSILFYPFVMKKKRDLWLIIMIQTKSLPQLAMRLRDWERHTHREKRQKERRKKEWEIEWKLIVYKTLESIERKLIQLISSLDCGKYVEENWNSKIERKFNQNKEAKNHIKSNQIKIEWNVTWHSIE